jgi:hypothetical protein
VQNKILQYAFLVFEISIKKQSEISKSKNAHYIFEFGNKVAPSEKRNFEKNKKQFHFVRRFP